VRSNLKVVGTKILTEFAERHADVRSQIEGWFSEVEDADWKKPQDIKNRYHNASFLAGNRVAFNLKGKRYRLLTKVSYDQQIVFVVKLGTHAEYSTWDL
jgi:mRNA interferase HigB